MPESSAHRLATVLSGQSTEDSDVDSGTSRNLDPVEVSRTARLVSGALGEDWGRGDLDEALDDLVGTDTALRRAVVGRIVNPRAGRVRGRVRMGDGGSGRSATSPRKPSAARLAEDL